MVVLIRTAAVLAAVTLAGCYDPSLRDCTVTCHGAGECASGQVCGTDGYCAAPAIAGTCEHGDASDIDASIDAPPADARLFDAPPDAMPAQLHITVVGKGTVVDSTGVISCTADCMYTEDTGAMVTLIAVNKNVAHPFVDWTTANCMGMGTTCDLTIVAPTTTVTASFK